MSRLGLYRKCIVVLICFIFISMISMGYVYASEDNPRETPVVKVVRENADAVVNISTERLVYLSENPFWGRYGSDFDMFFEKFFGYYTPRRALKLHSVGSGVILDSDGIIVTNAHVVNMASNVVVILRDGKSVEGKVMYEDPKDDIAIIKIDPPESLHAAKLGKPGDIMIGETVVAIGNPLGLENSVTVGVVSGKNRKIESNNGQIVFDGLLQIDAPINPGNSGGALLNLNGELVGINVAVVQNSQSIGFAIPVDKVKKALEEYRRNKIVSVRRNTSPNYSTGTHVGQKQIGHPNSSYPLKEQWDPFAEMERMRERMRRMFEESFSGMMSKGGMPGMFNTDMFYDTDFELKDLGDRYEMRINISGLNKNKIDIEIHQHSLSISGEYSEQTEETTQHSSVRSHTYGSFLKSISLPDDADTDKMTTTTQGDELIVTIPKKK